MNALRYFGERNRIKSIAAFFVMFVLSACGKADKPTDQDTRPQSLPEVTITIDAKGNIILKDSNGRPIDGKCSDDPTSKDACPLFREGHKVQVESITNISIIQYHGSPGCVLIMRGGVLYSYCSK